MAMLTKRQSAKLNAISKISTMEGAYFGNLQDKFPVTLNNMDEVDTFIKSHIRLWLETWITALIDEILEDANAKYQE